MEFGNDKGEQLRMADPGTDPAAGRATLGKQAGLRPLSDRQANRTSPHPQAADHVALAFHIARMYLRRAGVLGLAWEDLRQEAVIGLLRAGQGFNPAYGVKFSSYAGVAIRHHLHNVLSARRYRANSGLPTTENDAVLNPEDHRAAAPDHAAILADEKDRVARLLRRLHPRECAVLRMHFWDELSFARIGARVGVSGERARQICEGALRRLRQVAPVADSASVPA